MTDQDRGSFIWYELMTTDAGAARDFYKAVIGWDIAAEPTGDSDMDYRMIQRSDGGMAGGVLVLTEAMCAGGAKPGWLGYIHTPDVDGTLDTIKKAGGDVQMPPADMPGVGRIAMVADPQGAHFYLMTPVPPAYYPDAKSDVFDVVKPQHCRWNQLQTTGPMAAVMLYRDLFGWQQEGSMPMGNMGDYLFIQNDGVGIGAIMPLMPDVPDPVWSYFFGVDDIDRATAEVVAGGGRLDGDVQQIPGGEFSVHCFDPQGAGFGLVGPRKGN